MRRKISFSTEVKASKHTIFDYLSLQETFERLLPPYEKMQIMPNTPTAAENPFITFKIKIGFFWFFWKSKIQLDFSDESYSDHMQNGPFRFWRHNLYIKEIDSNTSQIIDEIEYELPPFPFLKRIAIKKLRALFAYRYRVIKEDLNQISMVSKNNRSLLLIGASGFVGSHLKTYLGILGYDIYTLTREKSHDPKKIYWDVKKEEIEKEKLKRFDVVINLAGENIFGYWSKKKKKKILSSRIDSTRFIVATFSRLNMAPKVWINASADGYYGYLHQHILDETSPPGEDFLAQVCMQWEEEALKMAGSRIVLTRFSPILHPREGIVGKLMPFFRLFLGAYIGKGKQYMSWIYIDDVCYLMGRIIDDSRIEGPINFSTGHYVTNKQFSKKLAKALSRFCLLSIPKWLLLFSIPEMARTLLLASKKVLCTKLAHLKDPFSYPTLEDCFSHMLGKETIDEME